MILEHNNGQTLLSLVPQNATPRDLLVHQARLYGRTVLRLAAMEVSIDDIAAEFGWTRRTVCQVAQVAQALLDGRDPYALSLYYAMPPLRPDYKAADGFDFGYGTVEVTREATRGPRKIAALISLPPALGGWIEEHGFKSLRAALDYIDAVTRPLMGKVAAAVAQSPMSTATLSALAA